MFQRLMLRLMGLEQTPPDPFEGNFGGLVYHVDALPKGNVSIWLELPRDRMRIEPLSRKRNDEDVKSTRFEHFIEALWKYGVQSLDVGCSGERIEVVIPAYFRKVDRGLAEQVAALMVHIRNEALGEQPVCESPRPWSKAADGAFDFGGQTVRFEFSSCLVYTKDDLTGNLDVMVRTSPNLPAEKLSDSLWLALPGFDDLVGSDAYGKLADEVVVVSFGLVNSTIGFSDDVCDAVKSLQEVEMFWGDGRERKLATLPCEFV